MCFANNFISQNGLPKIDIKDINGKPFNTKDIKNDGKPLLIVFWAIWSKPSVKQLDNMFEEYDKWQRESGVKIIAVSEDDAHNAHKLPIFVQEKAWDYEIYSDEFAAFRSSLSIFKIPTTILLNHKMEIVWRSGQKLTRHLVEITDQLNEMRGHNNTRLLH